MGLHSAHDTRTHDGGSGVRPAVRRGCGRRTADAGSHQAAQALRRSARAWDSGPQVGLSRNSCSARPYSAVFSTIFESKLPNLHLLTDLVCAQGFTAAFRRSTSKMDLLTSRRNWDRSDPAVGSPGRGLDAGGVQARLWRRGPSPWGAAPGSRRDPGKGPDCSARSCQRHHGVRRDPEVSRYRRHHAAG